jgi:indolepyruvate ferredoxin oxidoreductase beta subunit
MELQMVIAGLGGEGIVFMTRILAESVFRHGHPVISSEIHGMAMRGGSVTCQLKIGGFQSPMIRYGNADLLIATSEREVERNLLYLKKGGKVFIDSPNGGPYSIDAKGMAYQLGNPQEANLVLLGYVVAKLEEFNPRIFEETIRSLSNHRSSGLKLEGFRKGFQWGIPQSI